MSTRINEFSSNLMTNALGKMKETKEKKSEQAFFALLDSVSADTGANEAVMEKQNDDFCVKDSNEIETMTGGEQTSDVDAVEPKVESKEASDDQYSDVENESVEENTDVVIDKLCKELNVSKDELLEQFEQLLDAISGILMEQFGVTEEKLNQVLDSLGVTLMDMFNQKDLMDVAAMLSGAENIMEVLTNEDLYQKIQSVYEEIQTVKDELPVAEQLDISQLQVLEEHVQRTEPVQDEENIVEQDVRISDEKNVDVAAESESDVPELEVISQKTPSESKETKNQGQQLTGNEGFQHFANKVVQAAGQMDAAAETAFARQADMEAIIRQVTDHVKIHVQADTTSLEMQLNPESYGKLQLQVVVREGMVTARMAVENEAVRAALEGQIVQLKEAMNERGLQVQAVEVTIASHEFERSLQQENQENQAQDKAGNTTHRQINLQNESLSIEELAEMSEAEALTRKIMLENGNSINFTA